MVMSWIWTGILLFSIVFSVTNGTGQALSAAILSGAQSGVTLAFSMAGSICLWSGAAKVMEHSGMTAALAKLLSPITYRIFPGCKANPPLAQNLSGNICANFLGLGNAATPLGIKAVKEMADPQQPGLATNEMCRLVVLNTASIQAIPATVAAVRASLGCISPFDILPAVWITSLCSASAGLLAAFLMGKAGRHD